MLQFIQFTPTPMRLSPATRLRDRQTVWVAYRNDGSNFNAITDPVGHPAAIWSEAHAADEVAPCPISGWRSTQWG
jgi:hypothetical protein